MNLAGRIHRAWSALVAPPGPKPRVRAQAMPAQPGPWTAASQHPRSVLFITLDSCRFDTFAAVAPPHIGAVGALHRAQAPSYFTYGSHMAMFAGFTPGCAELRAPFVNPKFGKFFRLSGGPARSDGLDAFSVDGENIIDGFGRMGYLTAGTGAAGWFDDSRESVQPLIRHFMHYRYAGNCWSLDAQLAWLAGIVGGAREPVFAFVNVGETHVPYWHAGAPWPRERNPCRPFADDNDADECRRRQGACLQWVDGRLAPLLAAFSCANVIICGDHGDAWGEDGVWEHGVSHPKVLEVPLIYRLNGA